MTLRIDKSLDGEFTILLLAGELRCSELPELRPFIESAATHLKLDLQELSIVDAGAVQFLGDCETSGIELIHCPAYVREWMNRAAERARDRGERREL